MAAHRRASRREAIAAWEELKKMDAPKTYIAWVKAQNNNGKA